VLSDTAIITAPRGGMRETEQIGPILRENFSFEDAGFADIFHPAEAQSAAGRAVSRCWAPILT
jgi:hypothetical protein